MSADRACAGCEYAESDREVSENVALAPAALANANEDRARGVSARGVSARAMVGAGAGWSELPMALEALLRTSDYIPITFQTPEIVDGHSALFSRLPE